MKAGVGSSLFLDWGGQYKGVEVSLRVNSCEKRFPSQGEKEREKGFSSLLWGGIFKTSLFGKK